MKTAHSDICRRTLLLVAGLLAAASQSLATGRDVAALETAVLETPHFVFHSDSTTNINDALLVAGGERRAGRPELFHAGDEKECFDALAPSARLGWNLAVDWYAEIISPTAWDARQQYLIRLDLAGVGGHLADDERAQQYLGIARGFQAAAKPAYEACRWTAQDTQNRTWIEALAPALAAHEAIIAPRLAELYKVAWHGLPIRVDAVEHAPRVGANSIILSPAGGHILISSAKLDGDLALEIVFHEASHTLSAPWRPDPIPKALSEAAAKLGVDVIPRDLWHVVLFYTTGRVVGQALVDAGTTDFTPYLFAFEHFGRGEWGLARDALDEIWPDYIAGERTLDEVAEDLVGELRSD